MNFKPQPHYGGWISLGLSVLMLIMTLFLVNTLGREQNLWQVYWLTLGSLFCLGLMTYLLHRAIGLFTLRYSLTRNGLEVRFGIMTHRLPIAEIEDVSNVAASNIPQRKLASLNIPLWWIGRWGNSRFFTTDDTDYLVAVRTANEIWYLSPVQYAEFVRSFPLRQELGPTQIWEKCVLRWHIFGWPIWFDKLTWRLAGGAIVLGLLVVGACLYTYPSWPPSVPVGLNTLGQSQIIISKDRLLWLPGLGIVVLGFNLLLGAILYHREKVQAYVLWSAALAVQVMVWVGVRMVIG